jgi:hypothetical protein
MSVKKLIAVMHNKKVNAACGVPDFATTLLARVRGVMSKP